MLAGGARWAVAQGYGRAGGPGAHRGARRDGRRRSGAGVRQAKRRQRDEMGTLGSGNHYLEVQHVVEIFDRGGRGRLRARRRRRRRQHPLRLARPRPPDRHRVPARDGDRGAGRRASSCPTANSPARRSARRSGKRYLGAMRAAINCALANRQILTHLTRQAFRARACRARELSLLYDVSHNTCKVEDARGRRRRRASCYVHRKGATRAFGPAIPTCRPRCARRASRC